MNITENAMRAVIRALEKSKAILEQLDGLGESAGDDTYYLPTAWTRAAIDEALAAIGNGEVGGRHA
jgi:hypothetical protein